MRKVEAHFRVLTPDRLRDAVGGREVDRVPVTAPDRLARDHVHRVVLLEEWSRASRAAEFLDRPMDDDPHDRLARTRACDPHLSAGSGQESAVAPSRRNHGP